MGNKGKQAERAILQLLEGKDSFTVKNLNGKTETIKIEKLLHYGQTTKSKVDITLNNNYRLQIKSTKSNRAAVVNMVPIRNWKVLAARELMDIKPVLDAIEVYSQTTKKVIPLHLLTNDKEDWKEIIDYFLFEGTTTSQAEPFMQSTHLLDIDGKELLLIDKKNAFDYLWKGLTFELRTRAGKTESCVHIRYKKLK